MSRLSRARDKLKRMTGQQPSELKAAAEFGGSGARGAS
jgi:hypothetical protein